MFGDSFDERISLVKMNAANLSDVTNISFPCVGNGTFEFNQQNNYLLFQFNDEEEHTFEFRDP